MMLSVVVYENSATIKIVGDRRTYAQDLKILRDIPGMDRRFDRDRSQWVVKNIAKYATIPGVASALEARKQQIDFLGG
jgi:hypothetical protein